MSAAPPRLSTPTSLDSWQQFVAGVPDEPADVRPEILASWHRCRAANVHPTLVLPRAVADDDLAHRLAECAELLQVARPHLDWLSATYAALPHAAFLVDRDGIVLHATTNAGDAVDSSNVLPGTDWSEPVRGTNGAGTALATGEPVSVEGAEHWVSAWHAFACAAAPLRGPDGDILGVIALTTTLAPGVAERLVTVAHAAYAVGREIEARQTVRRTNALREVERQLADEAAGRLAALEALRGSEARYAHIAASMPGVVYQFVFRPDGTRGYTFISEGVHTVFGIRQEDAMRDPMILVNLIHPDEREEFVQRARRASRTLEPFQWEGRGVLSSGEERFVQVAARDRRLPDGTIVSDGLIVDVTELRRATRRLEVSEQEYRSLFYHNPHAVYSVDVEGRFISANPACEAVSGFTPQELLGQSFEPLIDPGSLDVARENFVAALGGRASRYEVALRHRSGRRVEIGVTNVPMIVGDRVVGVFGIAEDLSERRELEARLRQSQKLEAVGRLAGGVAHDFNNLLTIITTYTELARAALPEASSVARDLGEVQVAAGRATALTHQLLAFGRQQVLRARRVDANAVVSEVAGMLRRVIGEDITLHTELGPALWPVMVDPGQLSQVLMNLAVNARDAMPSGGSVRLRTSNLRVDEQGARERPGLVPGDYVVLAVEDTGVGIAPSVLPHVFEPFYTTKEVGRGTGLGLATVYGIVDQSGGHVYVDSTVGAGTRFTVLLPRTTATPEAMPAVPPFALPRGTETILLVEDERPVRGAVRRLLERLGYTVLEAEDGDEAIRVADEARSRGEPLHLVLTDVVMPGQNGRALVEQLRDGRPGLAAIYMSGYTDDEILRRGVSELGAAFLEKPFSAERLAGAVRAVLDR